jgi:hypothetical protein
MRVSFSAILRTELQLERAVQFFGPSQQGVTTQARGWLQANGQTGDEFEFFEVRQVGVGSLRMTGRDKSGMVELE